MSVQRVFCCLEHSMGSVKKLWHESSRLIEKLLSNQWVDRRKDS